MIPLLTPYATFSLVTGPPQDITSLGVSQTTVVSFLALQEGDIYTSATDHYIISNITIHVTMLSTMYIVMSMNIRTSIHTTVTHLFFVCFVSVFSITLPSFPTLSNFTLILTRSFKSQLITTPQSNMLQLTLSQYNSHCYEPYHCQDHSTTCSHCNMHDYFPIRVWIINICSKICLNSVMNLM